MEKRFVTTMNEIPGYEIVETRGIFNAVIGFRGIDTMVENMMKKAEAAGCNAIVRVRFVSGYGGGTCSCFPRSLIFEKLGTENQRFSSLDLQNGVSRAIFAHVFAQKKEQIREFEHSGGREQSLWL